MIVKWGVSLPEASELPALPRGVVLHWTGGGTRANSVALRAYHYVVESDATVEQGVFPVAANMRQITGDSYAAHTGGWNSYRVGLSAAGMRGYAGRNEPGDAPLTAPQIRRLCELAAYSLSLNDLDPLNPAYLCTHLEVWTIHRVKGTRNHQKLDIEYLPFRPEIPRSEVGPFLRRLTAEIMSAGQVLPEIPRVEPKVVGKVVELAQEVPTTPPNREFIVRPTPADIDYIAQMRGLAPEAIKLGVEVMEALGRRVLKGRVEEVGEAILKETIDAAADWLKARV